MYLGVDIGGTDIKYGVLDENRRLVWHDSQPTLAGRTDRAIVDDIIAACRDLIGRYPVGSIGLGSPGHVLSSRGVIKKAANLPFRNTPIADWVSRATARPVFVGNDANCAAWGEFCAGGHPAGDNLVLITLGTGVGGGMIFNRRLYLGRDEGAGEIGHICIDYRGLPCKCGRIGCLEAYASVSALISQTQTAIRRFPDSLLARSALDQAVSGKTAFTAAKAGCPAAARVIDQYLRYLATGINSLIMLLRPDTIVLAGGITNEGSALLDPLQGLLTENCDLRLSNLKNDAGIIGAALLGAEAAADG